MRPREKTKELLNGFLGLAVMTSLLVGVYRYLQGQADYAAMNYSLAAVLLLLQDRRI